MSRGRPKGGKDSYCRSTVNYRGGKPARKVKDTFGYFKRWELLRINQAEALEVSLMTVLEEEMRRRYLLKEYCCVIGKSGRAFRKLGIKKEISQKLP